MDEYYLTVDLEQLMARAMLCQNLLQEAIISMEAADHPLRYERSCNCDFCYALRKLQQELAALPTAAIRLPEEFLFKVDPFGPVDHKPEPASAVE